MHGKSIFIFYVLFDIKNVFVFVFIFIYFLDCVEF